MPIPARPLHTWGMDLIGPMPDSPYGNKYILTCIDHLTGWAEAIPIPDKSNEIVWKTFNKEIVGRYGLPAVVVTDNGGEFTASSWEKWLAECGIEHHHTTPYHPQSNGKVERFNQTLQKLLAKSCNNELQKWEDVLPDALLAYRCSVSESTRSTPYQHLFGQRPRIPHSPVTGNTPGECLRCIRSTTQFAQSLLQTRAQKDRARRNLKVANTPLQEGDFVSLRVHNAQKLSSRWEPGFQVLQIHGPVITVGRIDGGEEHTVNREHVRLLQNRSGYDLVKPVKKHSRQKDHSELPSVAGRWRVVRRSRHLPPGITLRRSKQKNGPTWRKTEDADYSHLHSFVHPHNLVSSCNWSEGDPSSKWSGNC